MKKFVTGTTYMILGTMHNALMHGFNVVCKNEGYR